MNIVRRDFDLRHFYRKLCDKRWIIVFYTNDIDIVNSKNSMINDINNIAKIYCISDNICSNRKILVNEIKIVIKKKIKNKLIFLKTLLLKYENIICINNPNIDVFNTIIHIMKHCYKKNIFAKMFNLDDYKSHNYYNLMKKMNMTNIVTDNILVVSDNNKTCSNTILEICDISEKMKILDDDLLTIMSMSLHNKIYNSIKDLEDIYSLQEKIVDNYEINESEYIFYPKMSICTNNIKKYRINADIFDTSGVMYDNMINPFPYMYKKFTSCQDGLFIKKYNSLQIIPKIIHHIWYEQQPTDSSTKKWKEYLDNTWQYKIWTIDSIKELIDSSRWINLYNSILTNCKEHKIIIYIAILEAYGGIIVEHNKIPIKKFTNEILDREFILSYSDEFTNDECLSFDIIGSLSGNLNNKLFDKIYNLFANDFIKNKNKELIKIIVNYSGTKILPSYYFNKKFTIDIHNDKCVTNDQNILLNIDNTNIIDKLRTKPEI